MTRQDGGTGQGWPPGKASHMGRPIEAVARSLALVGLIVLLAACGFTPQGDIIRDVVKQGTQKAGEAGLNNAIWFLCEGAPVGAVKRMYGGEKAVAYVKLCEQGEAGDIIAPKMLERSGG